MAVSLPGDDCIDMKPDFHSSILHNLFADENEELECSEELHLQFHKNDLIKSTILYRIAHSPYYKGYLMLVMPVLGILIIMVGVDFMKSIYCTVIVLSLCSIQLLCSLTRIDCRLLRSLYNSFEWIQFMIIVGVFVIFCGMSTGQLEPGFLVWSSEAIYTYIQFLSMTVPIAIMLINLDAIPLYPFVVKTSMLGCVLMLLCKVIGLDLHAFFTDKYAYNDPTQRTMCIGTWICTNAKGVTNLMAGQLTFFILRHLFILFQAWWKKDVWKPMTVIGIPLYIHPHFQREVSINENVHQPNVTTEIPLHVETFPMMQQSNRAAHNLMVNDCSKDNEDTGTVADHGNNNDAHCYPEITTSTATPTTTMQQITTTSTTTARTTTTNRLSSSMRNHDDG